MARGIKKLLVANRGEIAIRIMRTARTMGIATVAIYSDADLEHVGFADEAHRIGPPEPAQSYLSIAAILEAAHRSGADAIHPGYGFLSERPEFGRAVTDSGMIFVGPPPATMAALGDKLAARGIARAAEVPIVPGIDTAAPDDARRFADQTGYPILVKAAAGGGGRGMRVVAEAKDLMPALEAASREAQAAFGDGRIFLEKYLAHPRHIEIQILGDEHGKIVALGERDCSIQRRHQKIIEESPAPGLSDSLRTRIVEAALRLAEGAEYRNAGTAEFLVEGDNFYFLEVNARLQVEHPITEIRFDRDLVADQIMIAQGEHVIEARTPHGHAMECRINAEDAAHDFRPATGKVHGLRLPAGPGIRVDTHLSAGANVSPYYDSLVAKIISYGGNREEARLRMAGALAEFSLVGVQTTAAFLQDIVHSAPFAKGALSTHFLPQFFPRWRPPSDTLTAALIAAAAASAAKADTPADSRRVIPGNAGARSPWDELGRFEPWAKS